MAKIDLVGEVFEKLTVIEKSPTKDINKYKGKRGSNTYWYCECECGKIVEATTGKLRYGHVKSCGCLKKELIKKIIKMGNSHKFWKGYKSISGSLWHRIKSCAKQRKIEFSIPIEYAWQLYEKQDGKCNISNEQLYLAKSSKELNSGGNTASLDRIDSSKGYIEGNVQWVHVIVNYMKQEFLQEEFINWCKKITLHQDNKIKNVN